MRCACPSLFVAVWVLAACWSPAAGEDAPFRFERREASQAPKGLSSARLDEIIERERGSMATEVLGEPLSDEALLVRLSLDLVGRQPTPEEIAELSFEAKPIERAIDRLLASPELGDNWANYFSDAISYRTPEPELTFLNYSPFKRWLAEGFNDHRGWDATVFELLTADGKVGEKPAATFIGFHQANRARLASETTRVFLGLQTQCAECHDHPFANLSQETFHSLAAFFARTEAKLPWNDSSGVEVKSKEAGEHTMPGKTEAMTPAAFEQTEVSLGAGDRERRVALSKWLVAGDNPWFAKALVNRVWARLMGRGFTACVDDIGPDATVRSPETFDALARHFVASGYDLHELLRVIVATNAYRTASAAEVSPLRGDEVFDSLAEAIELPDYTPPAVAATEAIRFPPPPKSTRDLVNAGFGFDPSLGGSFLARTMPQAMFLMNNVQVQKQISADPAGAAPLARWLAEVSSDEKLIQKLYLETLGRQPAAEETKIALDHVASFNTEPMATTALPSATTGDKRSAAFEDLLWCLINSAEFTSRR